MTSQKYQPPLPDVVSLENEVDLLRILPCSNQIASAVVGLCRSVEPTQFLDVPCVHEAITAYRDSSMSPAQERMNTLYDTDSVKKIGYLLTTGGRPIGLTTTGLQQASWRDENAQEHNLAADQGIHFGIWLHPDFQGHGIGANVAWWQQRLLDSVCSMDGPWPNALPWTGIKIGNKASEKIVNDLFYKPVGIAAQPADQESLVTSRIWMKQ